MNDLDRVSRALEENSNLIDSVKTNIFELVIIFHNKFSDVSLEKLIERLKTLKIARSQKFVNKDISKYDFRTNTIYFNVYEMDKGYDMKHVFMFEILNMITATDDQIGFNVDDKFLALNVGYTEIFANFLVGNNGERQLYPCEAIYANMIGILIGEEYLRDAYFKNDARIIMNRLVEVGIEL